MFNRSKALLVVLSVLLVGQLISETVVLGPILMRMKREESFLCSFVASLIAALTAIPLIPPFTGCIPNNPSRHMWAYWIPMTIFETILLALAVAKCFQLARGLHAPKALVVLLRDSVLYLGGVLAILICNLVIWSSARVRRLSFMLYAPRALKLLISQETLLPIAIASVFEMRQILRHN